MRKLVRLEDVQAPRHRQAARSSLVDRGADEARGSSATFAGILHEHGLPQPISNGFVYGYEVDLQWPSTA